MIRISKIWAFVLMLLVGMSSIQAQDKCAPVGWATQNGGVTGGGNATPVVVTNYNDLKSAVTNKSVAVVHIKGTITFPTNGRINIQDQTNKTIFGLPGAKLISVDMSASGSGIFYVKRMENFILRNVIFEGPGAYDNDGNDNLTVDDSRNVWVDHCEFHDGMDGNFDIKNKSDFVSVTWCTFSYEKPPKAGGSGKANDHRYSNLIGSSDGATGDRGKLRITFQYCWWGEGCKERMPRVRFGKIHLANNYYSSTVANQGARAGFEADIRAEGNYFIAGYPKAVDLFENDFTAVIAKNNKNVSDINNGTGFTPPYTLTIANADDIVAPITNCGGATLAANGDCGCNTPPPVETTLTKGGIGSSDQTVNQGQSIVSFNYTWTNATSVTVTGLPTGITANIDNNNKTVTISGAPTQSGTFTYILSTTGGTPNVSYTRTFTVIAQNLDCNGVANGNATLDNCGVCTGGNTGFAPCTGTLQAETACTLDGSIDNDNAGFQGDGFVNTVNQTDAYVSWKLESNTAQTVTISFRYANGGTANRDGNIFVNGNTVGTLSLPVTGAWSTWKTVSVTLNLNVGTNDLLLTATSGDGLANIDLLHMSHDVMAAGCLITSTSFANNDAIKLYPNPTHDFVNWDKTKSWELYNSLGERMASGIGTQIDLSVYANGSYSIKIENDSFTFVKN